LRWPRKELRQSIDRIPGRNLANIEMRLIFAKMLWHFDIELADDTQKWIEDQYIYTTWEKIPLKIKLTPVER
jgi:cytochrome P450